MTDPTDTTIPIPAELDTGADPWVTPAVDALDLIGNSHGDDGRSLAVPVGLSAMDALTGGIAPGTLHVVCVPPGVSRSRLALRAALHAARAGHPTLACLLGPTPVAVASMLADLAAGPLDTLAKAHDSGLDAHTELASLPLELVVGQVIRVHDIRALAWAAAELPRLIVIDAISLLADGDAIALKHLAVDLQCGLLASVTVAPLAAWEIFVPEPTLLNVSDVVAWAPGGVIAAVTINNT